MERHQNELVRLSWTLHELAPRRLCCSLGDWGVQFGLLAVGFRKYGSETKLAENATMHLFDVYVKINADKELEALEGTSPTFNEARSIFKAREDGEQFYSPFHLVQ